MVTQPSGTVTLVFTDVEGSTRLLGELGRDAYVVALNEHRRIVRAACSRHGGYEVDGEGDAFFFAFGSAGEALAAVDEAMRDLAETPIRIRVGVHTGEPGLDPPRYVGLDVHKAARIMSAGHGGQVLLSGATRELAGERDLRDLGEHRLKDFDAPVRLFQVGHVDFPPLRTLNETNLPIPGSSFVGRQRELAEVTSMLRDGVGRLVTLAGPGGSGKTRLAIEAAAGVVGDYPDGVFWIGLADLREPALVVEAIARTLGAKSSLADHIGRRRLLLLLDNFEQLIDAAVELSALLGTCPELHLLVTSREVLRLQGEVEYQVPPLADADAEALFCARSRLPPDDAIADLCRQLDDLPLAVELAAARTAVLSPSQIRDRLSGRLDLFKGGRDADPRQRTLRATIEWSYELLAEPERRLFARLSIFAGGCTFDGAEEVAEADLDGLQSLVAKSLVRRTTARFSMLETIREFARERLEASGEVERVGRRHADHFLALAERAEAALKGADQPAWLRRLEEEHDNLRSSLDWCLEHGEVAAATRLAGALWLFWYMHGHVSEARRWLHRTLDAGPDDPSAARATVLDGAGFLAHEQGERDKALVLLEASLACARAVGATAAAAMAATHLGAVEAESDPRAGVAAGEVAVALAREADDDFVLAISLNDLGYAVDLLGDEERATAAFEESLALRRRIGDRSGMAMSLYNVAWESIRRGDLERAAALLAEALEIATAIGDKRHGCAARAGLGAVAALEGRWEEAEAHARASLRLARELGSSQSMTEGILALATIAAVAGDTSRAAHLAAVAEREDPHRATDPRDPSVALHRAKLERAKVASDAGSWERAWAAGLAMSLDEAAAYALSGSPES